MFVNNFRDILEVELTLPSEKVHEVADVAVAHANAAVAELRRLFLVEDFIDSLKFGVVLWCFTYLGSWFNGMTLIIIGQYFRHFILCYFILFLVFFLIQHFKREKYPCAV